MGEKTLIEWTDYSWSPWRGCTKISTGCAHCYAETLSKRNPAVLGNWGKGAPRVKAKNWNDPRKWNREFSEANTTIITGNRPRVFPSLCDWLDDEVPIEWLAEFLKLIHETPNLDWLLLTKRPENFKQRVFQAARWLFQNDSLPAYLLASEWKDGKAPNNVWLGVSVENQEMADKRIPLLLDIPAKVRFLSVEPLLGPVDLQKARMKACKNNGTCFPDSRYPGHRFVIDSENGGLQVECECSRLNGIHWVIPGGESGAGARESDIANIRSVKLQCVRAGVRVFVKQLGSNVTDAGVASAETFPMDQCWPEGTKTDGQRVLLKHPKGGDPKEWPADLRVREFPTPVLG